MGETKISKESLQEEWEEKYSAYFKEAQELSNKITYYCNQFNSQITIINMERHLMRREINKLYKFLKQIGNIGIKLTPFDYVAEDWLFNDTQKGALDLVTGALGGVATFGAVGALGTTATSVLGASALALAPTAIFGATLPIASTLVVPAYFLFSGIKKKQEKDNLLQLQKKLEMSCIELKRDLNKKNIDANFNETIIEIANLYRVIITSVRDTIEEKIIPELEGVLAFLYADAVKNCLINNEEPDEVRIGNIAEYRGTPYEKHYNFVRNVFDYYILIDELFKTPVLSDLLKKEKVSKSDVENFKKKLKTIGEQQLKLEECIVLGGE